MARQLRGLYRPGMNRPISPFEELQEKTRRNLGILPKPDFTSGVEETSPETQELEDYQRMRDPNFSGPLRTPRPQLPGMEDFKSSDYWKKVAGNFGRGLYAEAPELARGAAYMAAPTPFVGALTGELASAGTRGMQLAYENLRGLRPPDVGENIREMGKRVEPKMILGAGLMQRGMGMPLSEGMPFQRKPPYQSVVESYESPFSSQPKTPERVGQSPRRQQPIDTIRRPEGFDWQREPGATPGMRPQDVAEITRNVTGRGDVHVYGGGSVPLDNLPNVEPPSKSGEQLTPYENESFNRQIGVGPVVPFGQHPQDVNQIPFDKRGEAPRNLENVIQDIGNGFKNNTLNDDDAYMAIMKEGEDHIMNETDPELIVENFNNLEMDLQDPSIRINHDIREALGSLRDTALDKVNQVGLRDQIKTSGNQGYWPDDVDPLDDEPPQAIGRGRGFKDKKDDELFAMYAEEPDSDMAQTIRNELYNRGYEAEDFDDFMEGDVRDPLTDKDRAFLNQRGESGRINPPTYSGQLSELNKMFGSLESGVREIESAINSGQPPPMTFKDLRDMTMSMRAKVLSIEGRGDKVPQALKAQLEHLNDRLQNAYNIIARPRSGMQPADEQDIPQFSRVNPPREDEGPQLARSEQGGIKIGQNIKRSAAEVTTGYSRPLPAIMMREGMQNAIDAVKHMGGKGKIDVTISDEGEPFIEIVDNGKGMNRQQLETVFSDLYESGKVGEAGATGGKGIGKASYILGGKYFTAETITVQSDGLTHKYTIAGTPDEFSEHVDVKEEIVPNNTPTGTKINVVLKEDQNLYDARDMLKKVQQHTRGIGTKITADRYGTYRKDANRYSKPIEEELGKADDKVIGKAKFGPDDVTISYPKASKLEDRSYVDMHFLNNGMYQFSKDIYLGKETPHMPADVIIDIKPSAEEGTPEYPFPTQRESVKDQLAKKIRELVMDVLVKPQQQARHTKLVELYNSMSPVENPDAIRKQSFYDPGNRLHETELGTFQSSTAIKKLTDAFDVAIDNVLTAVDDDTWIDRLEGIGIVLEPSMYGVHIPNPASKKSTILVNPFEHIKSHPNDPRTAAFETAITVLHEAAHIGANEPGGSVRIEEIDDPRMGIFMKSFLKQMNTHGGLDMGHGVSFLKRLGEVYAKYGAKKTFDTADEILKIYTNGEGQRYSSELQRLLHIYTESRGRAAVTEDFLSGTGDKSGTPPKRTRGDAGNAGPNGERISQRGGNSGKTTGRGTQIGDVLPPHLAAMVRRLTGK